jgi:hypothetical protein
MESTVYAVTAIMLLVRMDQCPGSAHVRKAFAVLSCTNTEPLGGGAQQLLSRAWTGFPASRLTSGCTKCFMQSRKGNQMSILPRSAHLLPPNGYDQLKPEDLEIKKRFM